MLQPYLSQTRFHRQLFAILIIAILGFALFSSLLTALESSRQMKAYQHQQGQQIAENLARQSVQALLYQSKDSIRDAVQTTLAFPDVLRVKIVDKHQHPLISEVCPAISDSPAHQAAGISQLLGNLLVPDTSEELQFTAPVWNGQRSALDPQTENQELLGEVQPESDDLGTDLAQLAGHAGFCSDIDSRDQHTRQALTATVTSTFGHHARC
jgi:hypothetical protein